jgi:hypothetical protein
MISRKDFAGHPDVLAWPAGRLIAIDPLETDEKPVLAGKANEIVVGRGVHPEAGGLLVKRGQCSGIRAVERDRRQLHCPGHRQLLGGK